MFRLFNILLVCWASAGLADITGRVRVTDGDTFRVAGVPVRLHGIDAPELGQTCVKEGGAVWACGHWVKTQVRQLYQGRMAACVVVTRDRHDRYVARCRVDDEDVGQRLVQAGLAFAYRRYSMTYDLDEKSAVVRGVGLHGSRTETPAQYRRTRAKGRVPRDPGCAIKGNISAKGVRIFHRPGQVHYDATGINLAKGERWFCSDSQARAAGWRAAKR